MLSVSSVGRGGSGSGRTGGSCPSKLILNDFPSLLSHAAGWIRLKKKTRLGKKITNHNKKIK